MGHLVSLNLRSISIGIGKKLVRAELFDNVFFPFIWCLEKKIKWQYATKHKLNFNPVEDHLAEIWYDFVTACKSRFFCRVQVLDVMQELQINFWFQNLLLNTNCL